jgi:hypothetical protein
MRRLGNQTHYKHLTAGTQSIDGALPESPVQPSTNSNPSLVHCIEAKFTAERTACSMV